MTDNKYACPRCGGEEREAVPADQVGAREPTLNLAAWIDRRAKDVGPYADHIIHSVKHYEAHMEAQAARIERLEAALRPFGRFIDKDGEAIVLKWGDSTYSHVLFPKHFYEAHAALQERQS